MSETLKPCPFCKGEAAFHEHERFGVECVECGAGFAAVFESPDKAAAAWNARADEPSDKLGGEVE